MLYMINPELLSASSTHSKPEGADVQHKSASVLMSMLPLSESNKSKGGMLNRGIQEHPFHNNCA